MRYTIIFKNGGCVLTDWYNYDTDWSHEHHFMIIKNISHQYSTNGKDWIDIEDDHL